MSLCRLSSRMVSLVSLTNLTLAAFSLSMLSSPVRAQETDTSGTARGARQEMLKQVVDRVSQETGIPVLADSTLGREAVTPPDTAVTRATLEEYLTHLTRRLPAGTVWLKLYLPPPAENRHYSPDAVAQLACAQIGLLGRPAPNTVQIQGKVLSLTEATPVIRTLGLEPVYVLTSKQFMATSGAAASGAGGLSGDSSQVMDALTKQLGVSKVSDIPSGTYKVSLPSSANGEPVDATISVVNSNGTQSIAVHLEHTSPQNL